MFLKTFQVRNEQYSTTAFLSLSPPLFPASIFFVSVEVGIQKCGSTVCRLYNSLRDRKLTLVAKSRKLSVQATWREVTIAQPEEYFHLVVVQFSKLVETDFTLWLRVLSYFEEAILR